MKRYSLLLAFGVISLGILLNGCATKPKPAPAAPPPVAEEPAPAPPPMVEAPPEIEEAEVAPPAPALADVYFDFDKSNIRDDMRPVLEGNAEWLRANPGASIKIEGHCDERGTNEYNLALGERRAQAIKRFLVSMGVDASRVSTISFGEERPVCMDQNEECYARNRRGQFVAQ